MTDPDMSRVLDHKTRPAVFFDRDGVLIVDHGYVHNIENLEWIIGAVEAIRRCNDAGYLVFVATNQSGVARGFYDEQAVEDFHSAMRRELAVQGAHIDDFRYCPHHPQAIVDKYRRSCECRKPKPGMLLDLMRQWPVDRSKTRDIEAADSAGLKGFLFEGGSLDDLVRAKITAT
jgi:D-glycero-D-manno-heptose 1,7-bisphosphate phosphatase